jgi:hypothetical protein
MKLINNIKNIYEYKHIVECANDAEIDEQVLFNRVLNGDAHKILDKPPAILNGYHIIDSFIWQLTPEGEKYWRQINNKVKYIWYIPASSCLFKFKLPGRNKK